MDNWINIKKGLPDFNQNVLAILKSGQYVVLTYMKVRDYPWIYSTPIHSNYKIQLRLDQVVEWQSLPEPPTGENNNA